MGSRGYSMLRGFVGWIMDRRIQFRDLLVRRWIDKHPTDSHPVTARQVILLWLQGEISSIKELPERRRIEIEAIAERESLQVRQLRGIDEDSMATVERSVKAACRTSWQARSSWNGTVSKYLDDHPIFMGLAIIFFLFLPIWLAGSWVLTSSGYVEKLPVFGLLFSLLLLMLLFGVNGRVVSLILVRFELSWAVYLWRVFAVAGMIALILEQSWRTNLMENIRGTWLLDSHVGREILESHLYLDHYIDLAIRSFVAMMLIGGLYGFIGIASRRAGHRESRAAVVTAEMLLGILRLSCLSNNAIIKGQSGTSPEGMFRPYLASAERVLIIERLELMARMAEGAWKRSLKTGDVTADLASAHMADGIAAAARGSKSEVAKGGDAVVELHHSFIAALMNASSGNWGALAVQVSTRELLGKRVRRFLRHAGALLVMIGAISVVTFQPIDYSASSAASLLDYGIIASAALIAISLDPGIVDRIGRAGQLVADMYPKK